MTTDFENYLKETKFPNQKVTFGVNNINLSTMPINNNLLVSYILLLIALILINKISILAFAIVWIFSILNIWKKLESVNLTIINKDKKQIKIKSKNPIKYLLQKEKIFDYKAIHSFYSNKETSPYNYTRFQVLLSLKNGESILLTDFSDENYASTLTNYLNGLIK